MIDDTQVEWWEGLEEIRQSCASAVSVDRRIERILAAICLVFGLFGFMFYFIDPAFREDVDSVMSNYHMGVCVEYVPGSDYNECKRWGGF